MVSVQQRIAAGGVRRPVYLMRRLLRPRTVDVEGVRLIVDRTRQPSSIVNWLYRAHYEGAERILAEEIVEPSDRVIDGGGGMGLIALTVARIVGSSHIVSYEPAPVAFAMLQKNVRLNGLPIECRERALGAKSGETPLYVNDNILWSSVYKDDGGRRILVPTDAIADVVKERRANVLILDVEGAEIEIVDACPLDGIDKILVEIHARLTGDAAVSRMFVRLCSAGFVWRQDLSHRSVLTFLRQGRCGPSDRLP